MAPPHVLLLTGHPGVGKTTAVRTTAEALRDRRLAGFYTAEVRDRGPREGFRLITFDGDDRLMAHIDLPKTARVGRYGVDVDAIDQMTQRALPLDEPADAYLVDEIGKMECQSRRFVSVMRRLLNSDRPIVATIAQRGSGFIEEVKQRADAELWEVTRENRDEIPAAVVAWISNTTAGPSRHAPRSG